MDEKLFKDFNNELRKVLQNLYDPGTLRKSMLVLFLGISSRPNPATSLTDIILSAIHSIKPDHTVPPQTNTWRIYHILLYRYVEQTSQPIVAKDLSVGVRQLRRLEGEGVKILGEYLWKRYNLGEKIPQILAEKREQDDQIKPVSDEIPSYEMELKWLRTSMPSEISSIPELIGSVLKIIQPLTNSYQTRVVYDIPENLPPVSGQLTAVRQAITNILSAMLQDVPGQEIRISAEAASQRHVWLIITLPAGQIWTNNQKENGSDFLVSTGQLLELFQGKFEILTPGINSDFPGIRLLLPTEEQIPVLIVDDNTDTLRLFQRYLAGTRYRYLGAKSAEQAMELIDENLPKVVVLDVMMPDIDDWELLGRIRAHPQTHNIPVIVCTILPQKQLAEVLGASAFLRKPVSRQDLLSTLDQQLDQFSKE